MEWIIDKQFDFCYGHRVHNQNLNFEFSEDSCLACRHLHGHQGKIKIHLKTNKLKNGMVTDFKHLNWFKTFLDKNFDHKMIFDFNDPLLKDELALIQNEHYKKYFIKNEYNFYTFDLKLIDEQIKIQVDAKVLTTQEAQAVFEKYEGIVLVDFVPTSENLCQYFYNVVKQKMDNFAKEEGFEIVGVEFWETPKSHCKVISK